jgi:hypothetical protein
MNERIHVIRTGPRPVCEVVEPHDGISIVIRYAGNHKENLTLPKSVVPKLAEVLTAITSPSGTQTTTRESTGS